MSGKTTPIPKWLHHTPPAFLFYPDKWIGSSRVEVMTLAQQGAYIRLIARIARDSLCSIPADDASLANLSGLGKDWKESEKIIRSMFIKHPYLPEKLTHELILEQRKKNYLSCEKNSKKAKKAADKRWAEHRKQEKAKQDKELEGEIADAPSIVQALPEQYIGNAKEKKRKEKKINTNTKTSEAEKSERKKSRKKTSKTHWPDEKPKAPNSPLQNLFWWATKAHQVARGSPLNITSKEAGRAGKNINSLFASGFTLPLLKASYIRFLRDEDDEFVSQQEERGLSLFCACINKYSAKAASDLKIGERRRERKRKRENELLEMIEYWKDELFQSRSAGDVGDTQNSLKRILEINEDAVKEIEKPLLSAKEIEEYEVELNQLNAEREVADARM